MTTGRAAGDFQPRGPRSVEAKVALVDGIRAHDARSLATGSADLIREDRDRGDEAALLNCSQGGSWTT